MRKIFFLVSFLLLSIAGFSQFTVNVKVDGPCVYSQENTFYWAHVKVYLGTTLLAEGQGTSLTESIEVTIPEFCITDNTPQYKIVVDAMKAYTTPFSRICKGTLVNSTLYTCQQFVTGVPEQLVYIY